MSADGAAPVSRPAGARVRVLCVDDEPHIISGLSLQLRRGYEVIGAGSGAEGLAALREQGPFAVILSDMCMPAMDGATFLARARELAPDATRVLLTGHADVAAAIAAVNSGGVFRFLTKPCLPDELRGAVDASAEQHRLVTAERVLLEQTLRGAVKTLTEILAITSPVVFGRVTRVRQSCLELAEQLSAPATWAIEVAAMFSQLGAVTVPDEVLTKQQRGDALGDEEQAMLGRMSGVTERLLGNIPRLELVEDMLALAGLVPGKGARRAGPPPAAALLGAKILKVATAFDELESRGATAQGAFEALLARERHYDTRVLEALRAVRRVESIRELRVGELLCGMVFASDVLGTSGVLLVARGVEVNESLLERLYNFGAGHVAEPVRVVVRRE